MFCRDTSIGWNVAASIVSEKVSTISAVSRPSEKFTSLGEVVSGTKTAAEIASLGGIASARFSAGSVTTPTSTLIRVSFTVVPIMSMALTLLSSSLDSITRITLALDLETSESVGIKACPERERLPRIYSADELNVDSTTSSENVRYR